MFISIFKGKANSTLVYSGGELTLTMTGGQDNCHGTYTRKTVITFKCDHSTDGKNGSLRFIGRYILYLTLSYSLQGLQRTMVFVVIFF